jgi:hypothetical protein
MYVFQHQSYQWPAQKILPCRFQEIYFAFQNVYHQFVIRCNVETS